MEPTNSSGKISSGLCSVFQSNHEQPRLGCVHHLPGDASNVRWHEAGSGGDGALRHRPLLEPQEPHGAAGPHLPGHGTQPLPAQVLPSADQRVRAQCCACRTDITVELQLRGC